MPHRPRTSDWQTGSQTGLLLTGARLALDRASATRRWVRWMRPRRTSTSSRAWTPTCADTYVLEPPGYACQPPACCTYRRLRAETAENRDPDPNPSRGTTGAGEQGRAA
eukprot:scaffold5744_cov33-Phaeocystis_antarctica.AAC.1